MSSFSFTLVALALFSLVFLGFRTTPIFAAPAIDQSNTVGDFGFPLGPGIGQTFTPNENNFIGIDIEVISDCSGQTWEVDLHQVDLSGPQIVAVTHTTNADLIQHVVFPITPLIVDGNTYAVEVNTFSTCQWKASTADPYLGGVGFVGGPLDSLDFVFTTYYDDAYVSDTDVDGVPDSADQCPGADDTIDVDADGIPDCIDPLVDSDGDGVPDSADQCPGADDTIDVDADGIPDCIDPLVDSDGDGVPDSADQCPGADDTIDENDDGIPDCVIPQKKSCEALAKDSPGQAKGKDRARENNSCPT